MCHPGLRNGYRCLAYAYASVDDVFAVCNGGVCPVPLPLATRRALQGVPKCPRPSGIRSRSRFPQFQSQFSGPMSPCMRRRRLRLRLSFVVRCSEGFRYCSTPASSN
eukprot:scaffold31779_cov31-Tisochrysis_lutea.AAC.1